MKIEQMNARNVYECLVQKAERKGHTREEVDTVTCWLTGYLPEQLHAQLDRQVDYLAFMNEAPEFHPDAHLIRGKICGVQIESIEDPFMQKVRWLDKLVDELARGKSVEQICNRRTDR